ncbi:hypothetical protein [Nannocystis pusilla]|uniref:hypothetical protein n=1 Tax=Nannocystis pusilla TaxID=889268 RepID=UPI003B7BA38D
MRYSQLPSASPGATSGTSTRAATSCASKRSCRPGDCKSRPAAGCLASWHDENTQPGAKMAPEMPRRLGAPLDGVLASASTHCLSGSRSTSPGSPGGTYSGAAFSSSVGSVWAPFSGKASAWHGPSWSSTSPSTPVGFELTRTLMSMIARLSARPSMTHISWSPMPQPIDTSRQLSKPHEKRRPSLPLRSSGGSNALPPASALKPVFSNTTSLLPSASNLSRRKWSPR